MVEFIDVKKSFGKGDGVVQALRGINIKIEENEMVAIMGKSGSGKSTLLNIMGGMLSVDSGTYLYKGNEINFKKNADIIPFRRQHVGFIVQYFALIEDMTVFQNVALPLRYQKRSAKEIKDKVMETLTLLEIEEKEKAYPNELSGGQQQRVAIARALVKDPDMILADEPTGALDEVTGQSVLRVFNTLHQQGKTIVIVTHDENAAKFCHRTITLRDGVEIDCSF